MSASSSKACSRLSCVKRSKTRRFREEGEVPYLEHTSGSSGTLALCCGPTAFTPGIAFCSNCLLLTSIKEAFFAGPCAMLLL